MYSTKTLFAVLLVTASLFLMQGVAAFSTTTEYADTREESLGNQLARGATVLAENSWNNGTSTTEMTYEEASGDAARVNPSITSGEMSPGLDSEGNASTASYRVSYTAGAPMANGKFGWYAMNATTWEFDWAVSNSSNSDGFLISLCQRSAIATCQPGIDDVRLYIKVGENTTGVRVGYYDYDAAGTVLDNVTNSTGWVTPGEWHHIIMSYSEDAGGGHFLVGFDHHTFHWDTDIVGATIENQNWMLQVTATGDTLNGGLDQFFDNLATYEDLTPGTIPDILAGNISTQLDEISTLLVSILPIIVTVMVIGGIIPMINRSLKF